MGHKDDQTAAIGGGARFTRGPLLVGTYTPSAAFLRIKEHVAVMREDESLVALFGPMNHEASVADANLFAAAGDLLRALESLYALVCGEAPSLLEDDHHDGMVRAAIEKARATPTPSVVTTSNPSDLSRLTSDDS